MNYSTGSTLMQGHSFHALMERAPAVPLVRHRAHRGSSCPRSEGFTQCSGA